MPSPVRADTGTNASNSCRSLAVARRSPISSGDARSTLFTTSTAGVDTLATLPATKRSPGPMAADASTSTHTTSTSDSVESARSFARSPSNVRGLWIPGVSSRTICDASVVRTPRTWVRVVCGRSETIDTLRPTSWLTSVDLPTLGRPTIATNPERKGTSGSAELLSGRLLVLGRDLVRFEQPDEHRHDAPALHPFGAELGAARPHALPFGGNVTEPVEHEAPD